MSLIVPYVHRPEITLLSAIGVHRTLSRLTDKDLQIKWPNDLVLDSKKVCGILTEMSTGVDGIHYVIVGIGINVNRSIFPEEIAHMASSIDKGQGREAIVASLLFHFEEKYNLLLEHKNLAPFLDEYNGRLAGIGRQVQILSGGEGVVRTSHGIDEEGALIVSDEEGNEEKIISGEVSVRGLYGYV
jgi:BirA family biotin operon repressor/biotin-[acetyl-CoA-carboxylase] ligase